MTTQLPKLHGIFDRVTELSPRQTEVVELAKRGLSNKEIARRLGIEVVSVKSALELAYYKLGLRGRGRYGLMAMMAEDRDAS